MEPLQTSPDLPGGSLPQVPPGGGERRGIWIAPAAVLLGLAAGIFSTLLADIVGSAFGSPLGHPTAAVDLTADYLFDLSFVGAALYFTVLQGRMGRVEFGYRLVPWRVAIGALATAGVVYYLLTDVYASLLSLHGTDKLPSELGVTKSTGALVASAVFVCVVAPMAEEFFFRGFLFGVLRRLPVRIGRVELGPWLAALIVAFLFGLAHTGSASSQFLIPLGLLGFILCLVRWWTGSLYPCMALHSLNNCLALGINELSWSAGEIALLMAGSLALIAVVTVPLARPGALRERRRRVS
jgi:membrane protease YdiL (CAAX protease family)